VYSRDYIDILYTVSDILFTLWSSRTVSELLAVACELRAT